MYLPVMAIFNLTGGVVDSIGELAPAGPGLAVGLKIDSIVRPRTLMTSESILLWRTISGT